MKKISSVVYFLFVLVFLLFFVNAENFSISGELLIERHNNNEILSDVFLVNDNVIGGITFDKNNSCDKNVSVNENGIFIINCNIKSPYSVGYKIWDGMSYSDTVIGILKLEDNLNITILTDYNYDTNNLWNAKNKTKYVNDTKINVSGVIARFYTNSNLLISDVILTCKNGDVKKIESSEICLFYNDVYEIGQEFCEDKCDTYGNCGINGIGYNLCEDSNNTLLEEDNNETQQYLDENNTSGGVTRASELKLNSIVKYSSWKCHDKDVMVLGIAPDYILSEIEVEDDWVLNNNSSCKSVEEYMGLADEFCEGKCNEAGLCGVNEMDFGELCGLEDEIEYSKSNNIEIVEDCGMLTPCFLNNNCYPLGYRKDGMYCSDVNSEFVLQKQSGEACENSFECSSSICIDSVCIDSNLIQRIINWLKNLFG